MPPLRSSAVYDPAEVPPRSWPAAVLASEASAPVASPALVLRERLARSWGDETSAGGGPWAPAATLLLGMAISLLFWGAVAWGLFVGW